MGILRLKSLNIACLCPWKVGFFLCKRPLVVLLRAVFCSRKGRLSVANQSVFVLWKFYFVTFC